jgi:hypothetical protein
MAVERRQIVAVPAARQQPWQTGSARPRRSRAAPRLHPIDADEQLVLAHGMAKERQDTSDKRDIARQIPALGETSQVAREAQRQRGS